MAENAAQPLDLSRFSNEELERYLNPTPTASAPVDLSKYSDAQLQAYLNSQKALGNKPGDDLGTGALKGAATSTMLGLADYPGMLGNLGQAYDVLREAPARGVLHALGWAGALPGGKSGAEFIKQAEELGKKFQSPAEQKGYVNPIFGLPIPTGEGIAAPILERTGKYEPKDLTGQASMAGLRTVVGSMAPGAIFRGLKTASEGATPTKVAAEAAKGAAGTAPLAFGTGVLSDVATELTGAPVAGLIAGAAPMLGSSMVRGVKNYMEPIKAKEGSLEAQRQADIEFTKMFEDPEKAIADLRFQPDYVPGSPQTTAEKTFDRGALQAQKVYENTSKEFGRDIDALRGEANVARREMLGEMAPENANQLAPTQFFSNRAAQIEADHQANVRNLTEQAQREAENVPVGITPEEVGQTLRDRLVEAEAAADRATSAIYEPLARENITIVGAPVRDAAAAIVGEVEGTRMAKKLSGEEASIFQDAATTLDVERFSELHALEKRITNEVARNRKSPEGDPNTIRRLSELKTAIRNVFNNAAENQAAYEQSLVERGAMRPEETMMTRLQREADAFMAERRGEPTPSAPPSELPNMTTEQAERLRQGKEAHATQMETYEQGPVGQVLADLGFANQYRVPASGIPKLAFAAGDKGYTNAQAFLRAANNDPAAVTALQDMAMMRLRQSMGRNDTLTPRALDAWRNRHANALRAIDEVTPGFSSRFDNAAAATAALQDVQSASSRIISQATQGPAARFLRLTDAEDVAPKVGSMLKQGVTEVNQVLDLAGRDPQVVNGLRAAGVDYMLREFSNAGRAGGENIVSGAKLTKFMDAHTASLEALYGRENMKNMRLLAAEFDRAQDAASAQKVAGSDTYRNKSLAEQIRGAAKEKAPLGADLAIWYEFMTGALSGNVVRAGGAAATAGAKALFEAARQRGINNISDLMHAGLLYPEVGRAMLERGIDAQGRVKQQAVRDLVKSLAVRQEAMTSTIAGQRQQEERLGRATGGAVNLMALSKAAKKHVTKSTEDLLNESDDTVARALEVANKHI